MVSFARATPRRTSLQNGRWPKTPRPAPLVSKGEVIGASLEALGAEDLNLAEGPFLDLADAVADALVRPVKDCTLGRVRSKARQLERLVA